MVNSWMEGGNWPGGELVQGSIVWGVIVRKAIGIGGNCRGVNVWGVNVRGAIGIGGNCPGGLS